MKKVFIIENLKSPIEENSNPIEYKKIINKYPVEYLALSLNKCKDLNKYFVISDENEINKNINLEDIKILKEDGDSSIKKEIDPQDIVLILPMNSPSIKKKTVEELFESFEKKKEDFVFLYDKNIFSGLVIKGASLTEILSEDSNSIFSLDDYFKNNINKFEKANIQKPKKDHIVINNPYAYQKAFKSLRKSINKAYMKQGVFIEDPKTTLIEAGVEIGEGTYIEGGCKITGNTKIGKDVKIGFNSNIMDSEIGDKVTIDSSYIEKSVVERYTSIGPFARLRPNSHLEENVHIGNFVEVKNSRMGQGTKAGHLTYVGDADLGKDINLGCGVVFVNYDGKFKHRSVVEDGAFIGSNANIVAPVHIEKEGFIAAGSTITKDVNQGCLVLERAERKDYPGYVERKKERDAKKLKEERK